MALTIEGARNSILTVMGQFPSKDSPEAFLNPKLRLAAKKKCLCLMVDS